MKELIAIESKSEAEERFPCEWAVVAINTKGVVYIMDADVGFRNYEIWDSDDNEEGFIDVPKGQEDKPGVYRITNMKCVDDGKRWCHDFGMYEYDGMLFAGDWNLIASFDNPINT